jgi:hypothetical protein
MGTKLSAEEIEQHTIDNPNEGFDQCSYCNGIEPQNSMLSFDTTDDLICEECNDKKFMQIEERLDNNIDDVFELAHELFYTESGDITPDQVSRLDSLKAQIFDLILEQVKQNL